MSVVNNNILSNEELDGLPDVTTGQLHQQYSKAADFFVNYLKEIEAKKNLELFFDGMKKQAPIIKDMSLVDDEPSSSYFYRDILGDISSDRNEFADILDKIIHHHALENDKEKLAYELLLKNNFNVKVEIDLHLGDEGSLEDDVIINDGGML